MGKNLIRVLAALCISCLLAGTAFAVTPADGNSSEENGIEQIFINLPELTVYENGQGTISGENAQGFLGTEKLRFVSSQKFSDTGEGIFYCVLLDRSESMPSPYYGEIKTAITDLYSNIGKKDQMSVYSFGETVDRILGGTEDRNAAASAVGAVKNTDSETLLFEAINQARQDADKIPVSEFKRKVIVVISDGEDFATGKTMSDEALKKLNEDQIPVYALGVNLNTDKNTVNDNINKFGEFARMSGGSMIIFPQNSCGNAIGALREKLGNTTVLRYQAADNNASNQNEVFSIKMNDGSSVLTHDVKTVRWIPDTVPPTVLSAVQTGERQITVRFSEPVTGSNVAGNYAIRNDKSNLPVGSVEFAPGEDNTVILTVSQAVEDGEYRIHFENISDHSMEKNKLAEDAPVTLKMGAADQKAAKEKRLAKFIPLIAALIAAILILLIVILTRIRKTGKVVVVNGEKITASGVEQKKHVKIEPGNRKQIRMVVSVAGKYPRTMDLSVDGSLIVGRASICDVYFDDKRMSKQHFALEWDGRQMFVKDLDSTNGTVLNGIKMAGRHVLQNGDTVTAGQEDMTIRW